jgi:CHAT domain-containing protein/tetratricopeptide (TPR) repeat protein
MEVLVVFIKKNRITETFKILFVLFFLVSFFNAKSQTQENRIYQSIDILVANPNLENLNALESIEKIIKPKSQEEFLALVILNANKGYFQNRFGWPQKAILSYEMAWKTFEKNNLSNYDIVENCLKPLGNLYTQIGDFDNAENTIKQYFFIAENQKNQEQKIAAILNLSNVYQSSGKALIAIQLLEKSIKTEKLSDFKKGLLYNNLGTNYLIMKDFISAKTTLEKAVSILSNQKNKTEILSNSYRNLVTIFCQEQNFEKANLYFEKAKEILQKLPQQEPRKRAKFCFENAVLLFQQNKFASSNLQILNVFSILIPNYSKIKNDLPDKNALYAETVLLDALDLQAEILVKQNKLKQAIETFRLSFYIEDLFEKIIVYENSKIIAQLRIRNRVEKCLEIYAQLVQTDKKLKYTEDAFLLCEETKSRVLKNYNSTKKTASKVEQSITIELQNLTVDITKEQQKNELADVLKINFCIKKQNNLMLSLKKLQSKDSISKYEKFDLKALILKLEQQKSVLVEYFSGSENLYSFTLENQKIELKKIENKQISSIKIAKFIDFFGNSDAISSYISSFNSAGNELYKMLQLPNKSVSKNLIIIPDGLLNFVPFEALITKISGTTNFSKMNYLLKDFVVSYNNSASFYLKEKLISNSNKTVLGIFPAFKNTNFELSFSKTELQSLKSNFKGIYFENATATFSNFKKNASNFPILHLCTHADAGDTESPASIKFFDKNIMYSELYNLNIKPDLVVLSACQTGIGKLYKSEGAMSVARGFQFAGAENLLFSLWKVNDYTTSIFMADFYRNIKENRSFSEANHQAKLDFLNNTEISNSKKSPYYWSAFVYYGTIEKDSNSNYFLYFLCSIAVIPFFIIAYYRKQNHL